MDNDIEKNLFTEEEPSPKVETPVRTTEGKTHVKVLDEWWATDEGQRLIDELKTRYSDDVRAERKYMDRYEHNPFIVEYLRLYPEKEILTAARWYRKRGTIEAYYTAGLLYRICRDYTLSADCLSKAAEGDIMHEASFHLALMYEDGLLTEEIPDIPSAINWYRRGAKGMDRFSEASTNALKRLGVINSWAELGYDHTEMMGKRKKRQKAECDSIKQSRAKRITEKVESDPCKKGIDWEKVEFVSLMTIVLPCLAVSECFNWARFRFSSKYRKQVYRNLKEKEKKTFNRLTRPEGDDDKWQRDTNTIGRQIYTDEDIYPQCRISILVPETYEINTENFTVEEYYSVKVSGKFHCLDLARPETLMETGFLKDYMRRKGLTDATVILNDGTSVYERMKRYYDIVHEFNEDKYMSCYVELLMRKEPPSGIDYEKVSYHVIRLPALFKLEKDSIDRLEYQSERMFREYKDRLYIHKDDISHDGNK